MAPLRRCHRQQQSDGSEGARVKLRGCTREAEFIRGDGRASGLAVCGQRVRLLARDSAFQPRDCSSRVRGVPGATVCRVRRRNGVRGRAPFLRWRRSLPRLRRHRISSHDLQGLLGAHEPLSEPLRHPPNCLEGEPEQSLHRTASGWAVGCALVREGAARGVMVLVPGRWRLDLRPIELRRVPRDRDVRRRRHVETERPAASDAGPTRSESSDFRVYGLDESVNHNEGEQV